MGREVAVVLHRTHLLYYCVILDSITGKLDTSHAMFLAKSGDNVGEMHKHAVSLGEIFGYPVRVTALTIADWSDLL